MKEKGNLEIVIDEEGQSTFIDPNDNYFPVASDYGKIPNRFIEKYGNISYLANLGLMYAITKVEERKKSLYAGTQSGLLFEDIYKKSGTDYSEGLVAEFPISDFIKLFSLGTGGKTYQKIDELFNGELLRNQWQILYEDDEICTGTAVLTGTMYNKKTKRMYLKFNPDLAPVIMNIKGDYARISFPVLGKLKDDFVTELYQVLKKNLDYEQQKNKKFGLFVSPEVRFEISLEQFYFMMGLYPVDLQSSDRDMQKVVMLLKAKDYRSAAKLLEESGILDKFDSEEKTSRKMALTEFGYFRRHYLDKAFKKINGFAMPKKLEKAKGSEFEKAYLEYKDQCLEIHPTDIHFRYEMIKSGIGAKVSGLVFYVGKADWSKTETAKNPETKPQEAKEELTEDQMDFILSMKDVIEEKLASRDLRTLASAAGWNMDKIEKAYSVAKEKPRDNLVGFMIKAIEGEWESAVKTEAEEFAEKYSMEFLKKELDYIDVLIMHKNYQGPLDAFFDIIYDTMNSDATKIKIGQSYMPAQAVRDRLLQLDGFAISDAIAAFLEGSEGNVVSPSYVLTILYNIKMQSELKKDKTLYQKEGHFQK